MKARIQFIARRGRRRDIERTHETETARLLAGRAAECDIPLTDLSASLRHAEILLLPGGRVRISALGGAVLRADGRVAREAEFSAASAPLVDLAGHRLLFRLSGDVVEIDLEERPAEGRRGALQARRAFSLSSGFGARRLASWVLFLAVIGVGLAFPAAFFTRESASPAEGVGRMMAAPDTSAPGGVAARLWTSGTLSSAHRTLAEDCKACHIVPFTPVADETCLSCHEGVAHHGRPEAMERARPKPGFIEAGLAALSRDVGRPPERCTACHVEHNAPHGLIPTDQALCADCHGADGAETRIPNFAPVSDFGGGHPDFRPTLTGRDGQPRRVFDMAALRAARKDREARLAEGGPAETCDGFELGRPNFRGARPEAGESAGDRSGLIFPHAVHLDEDGCVAGLIERMGPSAPYDGALTCADCHTPEKGGKLFEPVRMDAHCSACHSLVFETVNGFSRTLRHGQPEDVVASMLDFYQAQAVDGLTRPAPERMRPGAAGQRPAGLREQAFALANARAESRVRAIFSQGGACFGCHEVSRPEGARALDFRIEPVRLRDVFHPAAAFSHEAHASSECSVCHDATGSRFSEDVLLPSIETCRSCHGGEHATDRTPSTCLTCHEFHGAVPDAGPMAAAARGFLAADGAR